MQSSLPHQLHIVPDRSSPIDALERLDQADDVVGALRRSAHIAEVVATLDRPPIGHLGRLACTPGLTAFAAIESLGRARDWNVGGLLLELARHDDPNVRRHATWRLGRRPASTAALPVLVDRLLGGGIETMHAHRALRRWADVRSVEVTRAVTDRLGVTERGVDRARLVDLLGTLPDRGTDGALIAVAADPDESAAARIAAIDALGDRDGDDIRTILHRIATDDDEIGAYAALVLRPPRSPIGAISRHSGRRIAQLALVDGIDGQLSRGGRGDTGGVASLLVSLGDALARRDEIGHVLSIGRGTVTDALVGVSPADDAPVSFAAVRVGDPCRSDTAPDDLWEQLPTIERGLRRVLVGSGPFDVVHLRMSDAGTLAAERVARALGIEVAFSLAPDPHSVVASLQGRGELDAARFPELEQRLHVWFRARLVERLAERADRVAVFPSVATTSYFPLPAVDDGRAAVVPEGIDVGLMRRVEREAETAPLHSRILDELAERIPSSRRGLPLLLSVGRLHPIKGMERLVAAWVGDDRLHDRFNLVIVGGDLSDPNPTEQLVLDAIDGCVNAHDPRRDGLVLLGGRPRRDTARLQIAARLGHRGEWRAGGVYVDGALKEEFGLAVLEALAAGLPVVAPATGGPATYVDDGDTGILVEPGASLADAIVRAGELVSIPGRAGRARRMVEERYSVDAMAARLAALYRPAEVAA